MLVKFTNRAWEHRNELGAHVDNETLLCANAAPSIGFLRGQTLPQIITWGMTNAEEVLIVFTKKEPIYVD